MNIFEDLIDELKNEQLLETTVIEKKESEIFQELRADETIIEAQTALENADTTYKNNESEKVPLDDIQAVPDTGSVNDLSHLPAASKSAKTVDFRERATLEVTSLQMVEHVLSGIEREQMKVVPKSYNDLEVKKALHSFLQISQNSPAEHAPAEFRLMQETESWYSSLSHRDRHISTAHLRRYCENTRPALSSQALTSLARFYRNSPYSESIRNKFDLVATRLFSQDIGNHRRKTVFTRDELLAVLNGLYDEWQSICLYSTDQEDADVLLTAFKFEDFMTEADHAESFDELIKTDFFNRLRLFKESTGEQFFAPLITAAAIESNVRIGNRYVELLDIERERGAAERLENKYGFLHDQVISDAASKTLQLVELLKNKQEPVEIPAEKSAKNIEPGKPTATGGKKEIAVKAAAFEPEKKPHATVPAQIQTEKPSAFSLNKLLPALTILILFASFLFYMKANNAAPEAAAPGVVKVNLENSSLKNFIKDGQISNGILRAVVEPSWENLNKDKKEEILKKIMSIGADKGFNSVQLQDDSKKTVGLAMPDKVEIY